MTLIGPSTPHAANDATGQSVDIRGLTPELIDGAQFGDAPSESTVGAGGVVRRILLENLGRVTLTADSIADLAPALLPDRSVSIADVAFFLQYSEPAAFHRSFRRWTGQTPQNYRAS